MALYYVNENTQSNGDHEVHTSDCSYLPQVDNRRYLGSFTTCGPAVSGSQEDLPPVQRVLLLRQRLPHRLRTSGHAGIEGRWVHRPLAG